jgi:cell division FtsZ-interacting protein ZapD
MKLKDRLLAEGMRLVADPRVAKLMQDERFMRLVMAAMAVPGRVSHFTTEQKELFAKTMGLATSDEVRDLKRAVTALEQSLNRLRERLERADGASTNSTTTPGGRVA